MAQHDIEKEWKGYTIDELSYQKAYTLLKIELQKEKLLGMRQNFMDSMPKTFMGKALSIVSAKKNTLGYVIAGYKLVTTINSIYRKFKKKGDKKEE